MPNCQRSIVGCYAVIAGTTDQHSTRPIKSRSPAKGGAKFGVADRNIAHKIVDCTSRMAVVPRVLAQFTPEPFKDVCYDRMVPIDVVIELARYIVKRSLARRQDAIKGKDIRAEFLGTAKRQLRSIVFKKQYVA